MIKLALRAALSAFVFFFGGVAAHAQTSPGLAYGQVLTAAQWNQLFANKQDYLGATACIVTGCQFTGEIITAAPTTITAGFNLQPGTSPTSPNNGDLWTTGSGLYVRINGVTIGPLVSSSSGVAQTINLNSSPLPTPQTGTILQLGQANGVIARLELDSFADPGRLTCVREDGTAASPTTLQNNDEICSNNSFGYNGTAIVGPQAGFRTYAAQNWSVGSNGTYADVATTPNGSATLTEVIRFENDGGITVPSTVTGGDKGAGTINSAGYYINGTALQVEINSTFCTINGSNCSVTATAASITVGGGSPTGVVNGTPGDILAVASGPSLTQVAVTGSGSVVEATSPTITTPVFSGAFSGTYSLGGTPSIAGSAINSGTVSATYLPTATSSVKGVVQGDGSTLTISTGVISCTTATTSQIGCAKPDGSTIVISSGVLTAIGAAATSIAQGTTTVTSASGSNQVLTTGTVSGGNGTLSNATIASLLTAGGGISITGTTNATIAAVTSPQGRLTLVSSTPVMTANQTAQSEIYYDCYRGGNRVPVYNGSADIVLLIGGCEITDTMPTSSTGVTNSGGVFDLWAINASGTLTICHATNGSGGGWASDSGSNTARGTGYSQLDTTTRSYITNKNSISHCYNGSTDEGAILANQATYLGTIYTTAAGQTGVNFSPSAAAGGTNNIIGLSNGYNRVPVDATMLDSNTNWTYSVATWRPYDGGSANANTRISWVDGLQITGAVCHLLPLALTSASADSARNGVVLDSVSATPIQSSYTNSLQSVTGDAKLAVLPQMGFHYCQAMEFGAGAGTQTFYGANFMAMIVSVEY